MNKTVPISTFFFGSFPQRIEGETLPPNVFYLGMGGSCEIQGMRLVVFSVNGQKPEILSSVVDTTRLVMQNISPSSTLSSSSSSSSSRASTSRSWKETDVLMTDEWPSRVLNHVSESLINPSLSATFNGIDILTHVAQITRPRYHFVPHRQLYFERPPFFFDDLDAPSSPETIHHPCRFLSIAPVSNPSKEKVISSSLC